jgi:hypothetical protein
MDIWIEIFKAGEYLQGTITEKDLDDIVSTYDPKKHEAFLAMGHPKGVASDDPFGEETPPFGYVVNLKRNGNVLMAKLRDVPPRIAAMLVKGEFKKRSASFMQPNVSPTGTWYLHHVALGVIEPEIINENTDSNFPSAKLSSFAQELWPGDIRRMRPERIMFHNRIVSYANKHRISYDAALKHIRMIEELKGQANFSNIDSRRSELHQKVISFLDEHPEMNYTAVLNHLAMIEGLKFSTANFAKNSGSSSFILHGKVVNLMFKNPGLSYEKALDYVRMGATD